MHNSSLTDSKSTQQHHAQGSVLLLLLFRLEETPSFLLLIYSRVGLAIKKDYLYLAFLYIISSCILLLLRLFLPPAFLPSFLSSCVCCCSADVGDCRRQLERRLTVSAGVCAIYKLYLYIVCSQSMSISVFYIYIAAVSNHTHAARTETSMIQA